MRRAIVGWLAWSLMLRAPAVGAGYAASGTAVSPESMTSLRPNPYRRREHVHEVNVLRCLFKKVLLPAMSGITPLPYVHMHKQYGPGIVKEFSVRFCLLCDIIPDRIQITFDDSPLSVMANDGLLATRLSRPGAAPRAVTALSSVRHQPRMPGVRCPGTGEHVRDQADDVLIRPSAMAGGLLH